MEDDGNSSFSEMRVTIGRERKRKTKKNGPNTKTEQKIGKQTNGVKGANQLIIMITFFITMMFIAAL